MSWSSGDLGQIGADDRWRWHVPWRWHGRSAVDRDGCCCTKSYCARRLGLQMFDLMNKHEPLNPSQDGFLMKYRRAESSKKNMTHMMVSKWTCGYISAYVVKRSTFRQSGPLLVIWNSNPYKWSYKWVTGIFATPRKWSYFTIRHILCDEVTWTTAGAHSEDEAQNFHGGVPVFFPQKIGIYRGVAPSQDASGKCRFRLWSTEDVLILVGHCYWEVGHTEVLWQSSETKT